MQTLKQWPRNCIFCAIRSSARFSTSTSGARGNDWRNDIRTSNRATKEREREEDIALHKGRFDRFDSSDRREPHSRSRSIFPDQIDRRHVGRDTRTHASFRPTSGESFSRGQRFTGRVVLNGDNGVRGSRRATFDNRDVAIQVCLQEMEDRLNVEPAFAKLGLETDDLHDRFKSWKSKLEIGMASKSQDNLMTRLGRLWKTCDSNTFRLHMKYTFYGHIVASNFGKAETEDQVKLANLRWPTEWFPATRGFQREFHLHVGPTNSGKTYHALKRLEEAKTGLYAGPLRLLAHEVYMRLNARGQRCNLVTGDERRTADDQPEAPMTSCTVEMVPLNTRLDVAVIDEIQMIGSEDRGWAWTQAVLGVMAKEVHCCGEERAVPIMEELAAMCGEKLHIHRYKRLSPLEMSSKSLEGDLRNLQKGDCIVAFKVLEIHGLRQEIERALQVKVAVIYGSLPPETRAQQAKLFNDPDSGYDILVASNAIGMGLNLSIKRLIFQTSQKFDGAKWGTLSVADTKQVAGRAGRYSTAEQDMKRAVSNLDISIPEGTHIEAPVRSPAKQPGLVTTLERFDFPIIEKLMYSEPEPIISAGVQPPAYIIERFAKYFPPDTPFAYLLIRLNEISETSSRFFLCDLKQSIAIADIIESVNGLTTTDRLIFCAAPIEPRKPGEPQLAQAYARLVAESRAATIVDVEELDFELLKDNYEASRGYLGKLESLHKGVIIWNWLSFRFAGVFVNRELAMHVKGLVEKRIEETLARLSFDYSKMRRAREKAILQMLGDEGVEKQPEEQDVGLMAGTAGSAGEGSVREYATGIDVEDRVTQWLDRMAEKSDETFPGSQGKAEATPRG